MRRWVSSQSYRVAIGAVIDARKQAGFTQRNLATCLGKPPSFVAKIETGERRLDLVEFVAIARALNIEPADLIERVSRTIPGRVEI